MPSLLQLPQNIWRDNVVYFLRKVEDLGRLDSAVTEKASRVCFHVNIDGCKRFRSCNAMDSSGKMKWLATHNILVDSVDFYEEPNEYDKPYIKQLASQITSAKFSKSVLSQGSELLQWTCSDTLEYLYFNNCNATDISAIATCSIYS